MVSRLIHVATLAGLILSPARAADPGPLTAGTAVKFLGVSPEDSTTVMATWNGRPTAFVEFVTDKDAGPTCSETVWEEPPSGHVEIWTGERDAEKRRLVAVQQGLEGQPVTTVVTDVWSDAKFANVEGFGFVNADRDRDDEIVVIVRWAVQGGVGGGYDYAVRIFDQPDPTKPCLTPLPEISNHFEFGFEGATFDSGDPVHAKFKTIRAVKRELRRLGY